MISPSLLWESPSQSCCLATSEQRLWAKSILVDWNLLSTGTCSLDCTVLHPKQCVVPEYPYPPQGRSLEISTGRAVWKPTFLKERKGKFPEGWGAQTKKPSLVGYGYFLEQCNETLYSQLSLNGHLCKTDTWCWSLCTVFQTFNCI